LHKTCFPPGKWARLTLGFQKERKRLGRPKAGPSVVEQTIPVRMPSELLALIVDYLPDRAHVMGFYWQSKQRRNRHL
jgi:hypothetical protein